MLTHEAVRFRNCIMVRSRFQTRQGRVPLVKLCSLSTDLTETDSFKMAVGPAARK